MSIIFKREKKDNIIQDFEVGFLRQNDFKIKSFKDLAKIIRIENERNIKNNKQIKWTNIELMAEEITKLNNLKENEEETIKKVIEIIRNTAKQEENIKQTELQQTFDVCKIKTFSLSPTSGIKKLNSNPYSFFIDKILNIKPIEDWNERIDSRIYGIIIHETMEVFANICKSVPIENINTDLFLEIANKLLLNEQISLTKFIFSKLIKLSNFAVKLEKEAKKNNREVITERKYDYIFKNVKINATADRVEIDHRKKEIYIYDFKTGGIPTEEQELKGEKTQLSIIALLLLQEKYYLDYSIKRMSYINFSGNNKKIFIDINTNMIFNKYNDFNSIEYNINELLEHYFENGKAKDVSNYPYVRQSSFNMYKQDLEYLQLSRKVKIISN